MVYSHSSNHSPDSPAVPPQWPSARCDTREPAKTVRGLLSLPGMLLLWLTPKRVGASLAAAGWRAAFAAHVIGVVYGIGLMLWSEVFPQQNPIAVQFVPLGMPGMFFGNMEFPTAKTTFIEAIRTPPATVTTVIHAGALRSSWIEIIVYFCVAESALILIAVAMMPFAAAGEPAKRLFVRCVKLTWWSTTMLIPVGIGFLFDPLIRNWLELSGDWLPMDYALLALVGLWWTLVLIRSGYRYAGPADGPGWRPRSARCEGCDYIIAHLSPTGNCPECGRPIADSLPDHRSPPPFAREDGASRAAAFFKTLKDLLIDRGFFGRLSVHRTQARDRQFFLTLALLSGIIAAVAVVLASGVNLLPDTDRFGQTHKQGQPLAEAIVIGCAAFVAQVIIAGLTAIVAALIGRRTVQSSGIVVFYLASIMPVLIASGALIALMLRAGIAFQDMVNSGGLWQNLTAIVLFALLGTLATPFALAFVSGYRILKNAIPQTRRACS